MAVKITKFETPDDDVDDEEIRKTQTTFMLDNKLDDVLLSERDSEIYTEEFIDPEIQRAIDARNELHIFEQEGTETVDVTPKPIHEAFETDAYKRLKDKKRTMEKQSEFDLFPSIPRSSTMKVRGSRVAIRLSMEDIIAAVGSERMLAEDLKSPSSAIMNISSSSDVVGPESLTQHRLPFIRVVLRKTELLLLFEMQSMTAIKNTDDGNFAETDNKRYDYLTVGRGKVRRRSENEAQTPDVLFKSRKVNTERKATREQGTYVSYFEMYDTYKYLEKLDPSSIPWGPVDEDKQLLNHPMTPEQQTSIIVQLPAFQWANMVMKRILSGNNNEMSIRRYRNMEPMDRTIPNIEYKYSMLTLFTLEPFDTNERRAVADISFCYRNNDILAVGYGIYSYHSAKMPATGEVCIWTIKNTSDPERYYSYNYPVVSLEFSPYTPTLLAIGLFDGTVEVRDITDFNAAAVAVSQHSTSPGVEPVLSIKWLKLPDSTDTAEIDPFIALSQDGSVTRYKIIHSPFLLGVKQMVLHRIEGAPEGLQVTKKIGERPQVQRANPHPQGLSLTKHPQYSDIYYIMTDEGCVHKCSTNYQHHYLSVLKTHDGSVNTMDFSPWSPKLFVTSGNDWRIRVWMEDMFKPLITLQNSFGPYQWAAWSRTHSTIILALNRKQIEVWDLKRSTLKPVSTHALSTSYNTMARFSRDGNSILIGNERGKVSINQLSDIPFPPHYQYDTLEKTIYFAVSSYPELMNELKSKGYFGYPKKGFVMPP